MFKIKKVSITGFWGIHTIETDFFNDVNIFIGKNGTGKTTFINLLQAVISVDLDSLYNLRFDEITIILSQNSRTRKIVVAKIATEVTYKSIRFQIGTSVYTIPYIVERDIKYITRKTGRFPQQLYKNIQDIKDAIQSLIKVSYLSVNRDSIFKEDGYRESRKDEIYNAIEARMGELMNDLTSYQLQLESDLSKLSKGFQENVLRSMLFNEEFDYVDINQQINIDQRKLSTGTKQAYRGLGILDTVTTEIIEKHVAAISKAAETINNHAKDNKLPVYPNDVTPLTLLRRTNKIIELSTELEDNKKRIFKPITDYINLLNEFHERKKFGLQDSKQIGLKVTSDDKEIISAQLSSGEKQLIILLTEALLQKSAETLFIADEPELSLHIEWQRKVVSSIIKLNPNAQIIIATHSPEIVGRYKLNTINMEKILYG